MNKEEDILLRKKIADALIKARKIVVAHKAEYSGIYKCSGGGGTTTSNTSTTVPPEVLAEYQNVTGQANQVASAPLQQYQGQVVAGQTPDETSAYGAIDNTQGITAPYTQQASGLISQATQNINPQTVTAGQIQSYESPYTQQVLNSTMAAENNQDAQQQAQLQGSAIQSGAWGGDRSAVAQGILGGQQAIANNATNAGIENQGYSQALSEANTEQQAGLGAQEASQYLQESGGLAANQLGTSALANNLTGANAQLTAGQDQQQQAQAELNVPYEQFLQEQAYPFQTTGWLGNIAEGIGSNEGGSSTSSTTQPSEGLFGLKRGGGIMGGIRRYNIPKKLASGGADTPSSTIAYNSLTPDELSSVTHNPANETVDVNGSTYQWSPSDPTGIFSLETAATPSSSGASATPAGNGQFTAQTAPTYAQFAASSGAKSGTPYTGGVVAGLNSANQADLDSIYSGKYKRGGIVPHRDAGGVTAFDTSTNPMQNNATSNYSQMSLQQLQQVAQRIPPNSIQGQAVQAALKQKQYMPNVNSGMKRGGIVPKHFDDGGAYTGVVGSNDDGDTLIDKTLPPDNGMGNMLAMASNSSPDEYGKELGETQPSSGIAPPPTPPVNATDHPNNSGYTATMPSDHEANPWLSVAAGVLGTLAGRSRNPLVDIGQGGLIGINNYTAQQKEANAQNYQEGDFKNNAQKLMDETDKTKQSFAQEKQNEADLQQYRQGELAHQQAQLEQGKFTATPMGDVLNTRTGQIMPSGGASSSAPAVGADGKPLTGDDYLATLPPQRAILAKKIAQGDIQFPSGIALRNPVMARAMQDAVTYDPDTNANRYGAVTDFTKGQSAKTMQALDAVTAHTDTMLGLVKAMDNGDTKGINYFSNLWKTQTGQDAPTNFDAAKGIYGDEVTKAVLGSAGGVSDREEAKTNLSKSNSPQQLEGALSTYRGLMIGQMDALQQRYQNGTGRNDFTTRLRPETRDIYVKSKLPEGTQFSPSKQQYKTPSGQMYDIYGRPVKQ